MKKLLPFVLLICVFSAAHADVRLPAIISNKMVLKQNSTAKLWGWANPNEKIVINCSWNNTADTAVANQYAEWSVNVKTPAAGGPHSITFKGRNTLKVEDVLIGEVWVCSGQSNMEWSADNNLKQIKDEMPTAANSKIRLFYIPRTTAATVQTDVKAQWLECDAKSLQSFSAVGYFFGKTLHKTMNIPVGLINSAWGGTPAEAWTPAPVVQADAALAAAAAKLTPNKSWPVEPGRLFNAMIAPIANFDISGAIWYQGESNVGTNGTYAQLFSTMIAEWRKAFNQQFPFYFVQIAPYAGYGTDNYNSALLRDAQRQTLALSPKTGMVVVSDLVDNIKDIHPVNKLDVGNRLAALALANTYGKPGLPYKYPTFDKLEVVKGKAIVTLKDAEAGLIVKGAKAEEVFIAGADKNFVKATEVKMKGNTITASNPQVKEPVAVRFGFTNAGIGNIFSKEGLPVVPFRTDSW
ncbi:sialate O-acetylesterase [Chitinophaga horti]|uniref:Sialate O-acetylesterase n=1 Tax=Chitinophaga horti TaxID=2920382 RepID=A0ABY6J0J9_9BACT|nr:sialate O-acetylesterase [Chitinophaga horti]UYQ91901.1 sialate O-acetylesterase [Chitinophaga horti]